MKTWVLICPVCHGIGTLSEIVACDYDTKPRHSHSVNCVCLGLGYIGKKSICNICNGKGYRDWVDDIRRPLGKSIYKLENSLDVTY